MKKKKKRKRKKKSKASKAAQNTEDPQDDTKEVSAPVKETSTQKKKFGKMVSSSEIIDLNLIENVESTTKQQSSSNKKGTKRKSNAGKTITGTCNGL